MDYDQNLYLTFLEKMYLIRRFEQKVYEFAERGLVFGSTHLEVGEEATAVGTLLNIKRSDYMIATHRGHGQELLKGTDVNAMMAEMIGKATGICGGRVGSMHVTDASVNNLGAQGIIGASFPISVGVGLALNLLGQKDKILISFFGDGATNQGNFYESLNMADIWKVPVFFVCVNNLYGMGTAYCSTCNIEIYKKATFFNIKSDYCDGNDVAAVYNKSKEIIDYVRTKRLPALLELKTYRTIGHSAFDKHPYRTKEEIEDWKKKDPIKRTEDILLKNGTPKEKIDKLKKRIDTTVDDAAAFAAQSPYPVYDDSLEQ
ncbi:MAG: thiamine pyrophosphate-dependent dehydrogenase E1 component subunit alpha [Actinobacteria bacterium]|nr:thiamine pyrophosphate-dependent dehydrogenase E1 component subunit alpha [Actinomycetota bacterium]